MLRSRSVRAVLGRWVVRARAWFRIGALSTLPKTAAHLVVEHLFLLSVEIVELGHERWRAIRHRLFFDFLCPPHGVVVARARYEREWDLGCWPREQEPRGFSAPAIRLAVEEKVHACTSRSLRRSLKDGR